MKLPTIIICDPNAFGKAFNGYTDCTSNKSASYDANVCNSFSRQCPSFYEGPPDYCASYFLGHCIALNRNGTKIQTLYGDSNEMSLDTAKLPLYVFIYPPGVTTIASYVSKLINEPGVYIFNLDKIKHVRLPAPYSYPSCVQEGSGEALSKNIFTGPYTRIKCVETCSVKERLLKCGMIQNYFRGVMKDKGLLKHHLTTNFTQGFECMKTHLDWGKVEQCKNKCYLPCTEEKYKIHEIFEPEKSMHRSSVVEENFIHILVKYENLQETRIIEEPSYDVKTLLANIGGTLGLMCGMSVISLIELLYWFLLFTMERCHNVYKTLSPRAPYQDAMV